MRTEAHVWTHVYVIIRSYIHVHIKYSSGVCAHTYTMYMHTCTCMCAAQRRAWPVRPCALAGPYGSTCGRGMRMCWIATIGQPPYQGACLFFEPFAAVVRVPRHRSPQGRIYRNQSPTKRTPGRGLCVNVCGYLPTCTHTCDKHGHISTYMYACIYHHAYVCVCTYV